MELNLQTVTLEIARINKAIEEEETRHAKAMASLESGLTNAVKARNVLAAGLNMNWIARGREVVGVHGKLTVARAEVAHG